jgi:hypothetical protein
MEKTKLEKPIVVEPAPEFASRDDVRVDASPLRCPFCHASVAAVALDWVACKACLARHHAACWSESGACASCGDQLFLPARSAKRRLPGVSLAVVLAVALVSGLGTAARFFMKADRAPSTIAPAAPAAVDPRIPEAWRRFGLRSEIETERLAENSVRGRSLDRTVVTVLARTPETITIHLCDKRRGVVQTLSYREATSERRLLDDSCEVVGTEVVDTPAGRFTCTKRRRVFSNSDFITIEEWMSTDLPVPVKTVVRGRTGNADWVETETLTRLEARER